jgi:uncharacterized protein (TIGR04141 family)
VPDRQRKTRYTIHLLREGTTAEDVIRGNDAEELTPTRELPYECRAFLVANRSKRPGWIRPLEAHFDLDGLSNQSSSFVLVLKVQDRLFALTAGYGHTRLDKRFVEHGFGVRVAASVVDPDALTAWEDRTVSGNTRQQLIQMARGGDRIALGVELDPRVIRRVAGATSAEGLLRISGTDSATVKSFGSIEELATLCATLLQAYESGWWRDRFPELEALERLARTDQLVERLDGVVRDRLDRRSDERLALAPLRVYGEDLSSFRVLGRRGMDVELDESLSLEELYAAIPDDWDRPLTDLRIVPVTDADEALDQRSGLRQYLVAEAELDGVLYALTDGQWYRVQSEFFKQVSDTLAGVDISTELDMPKWLPEDNDEAAYNRRVANERGWRLIDKSNVYYPERQKIEPCDLATPNGDLIYVKRGDNSKYISHLCKQADVAADLLLDEEKFTTELCKMADFDVERVRDRQVRFVIAVATDRKGPLSEDLFLFSKLSMRNSRRLIERNLGFRFGLARMERPQQPSNEAVPVEVAPQLRA